MQDFGYNNEVFYDLTTRFLKVTFIRLFFKSHLALILLLPIAFLTIFTGLDDSVLQVDEGADTFVSTTILKHGLPMHSDGLNLTMPYADIFDGVFIYRTWVPYYLQAISLYFLGSNTFAARLPFAIAGFFSIWCLYHLAIRLSQDKSSAVFATTFLATCVPALLYFRTSRYVAIPILLTPILLSFYFDIFENKKLNNDISYYLHRPSATDKSMAPFGQDCFYVLVPVPNNQSKIDWSIEGEKMKDLVIDKMEKDLMPNLRENIVADFYLTPDYFEKELNTKFGSGFSIQPKFTQSAYFRFHNKSEIYDGLYFVGAGTHPGAGVPGVLSSAKVLDKLL